MESSKREGDAVLLPPELHPKHCQTRKVLLAWTSSQRQFLSWVERRIILWRGQQQERLSGPC